MVDYLYIKYIHNKLPEINGLNWLQNMIDLQILLTRYRDIETHFKLHRYKLVQYFLSSTIWKCEI